MNWVPVLFATFKGGIFATCMFLAIKWHYDQGKKKGKDTRALVRNSVLAVLSFLTMAAVVLSLTLFAAKRMGMDLSL